MTAPDRFFATQTLGFITLGIIDDFADAVVADVAGLGDALEEARAAAQEEREPPELRDAFSVASSSEPQDELGDLDASTWNRRWKEPTTDGDLDEPQVPGGRETLAPPPPAPPATSAKTSKYCVECGTKLPRAAKFCVECGYKQPLIEGMAAFAE